MTTFLILLILGLLFWISPAIIGLIIWIIFIVSLYQAGEDDENNGH